MITGQINAAQFNKAMNHLIKNVRWGAIVALTRTVTEAKKNAVIDIHRVFRIRNHWVPGSIKTTTAEKGTTVPTAVVGTIQPFLFEHEAGGVRHAAARNKIESVPDYARHNPNATTKPATWPAQLIWRNTRYMHRFDSFPPWAGRTKKPRAGAFYNQRTRGKTKGRIHGSRARGGGRYFYLDAEGGSRVLLQRMSKGGKGKKNRVWWSLRKAVNIKPTTFWFDQIPSILSCLTKHIHKELNQALNHGRAGRV